MSTRGSGHGGHHANDNLLHLIAEKEKELESMVSDARNEVEAMARQARAEAESIARQARDQIQQMTREHEQRVAAEGARIQNEAEAKAAHGVDTLRRSAQSKSEGAVRVIVDRVVKGS